MARLLALLCVMAVCSAASGRVLLQGSPAPEEISPAVAAASPALMGTSPMPAETSPAPVGSPAVAAEASNATAPAAGNATFPTVAAGLEAANITGNLTTFIAAVEAAGLASALNDTTAWTILAPNNAAFEKAFTAINVTAQELLNQTELLQALLSYHVIPAGAVMSSNITNSTTYMTALARGGNLTAIIEGTNVTFVGNGTDKATVVTPDIMVGKSVIHVIDTVLFPPLEANVPANATNTSGAGMGAENMTSPAPDVADAGGVAASPEPMATSLMSMESPAAGAGTSPAPGAETSPAPAEPAVSPAVGGNAAASPAIGGNAAASPAVGGNAAASPAVGATNSVVPQLVPSPAP